MISMQYKQLQNNELSALLAGEMKKFKEFKEKGFKLDLTRGKPCKEQLDLSMGMFDIVNSKTVFGDDKNDYRNYGFIKGVPELNRIFAKLLGVDEEEIISANSSSLCMMYDAVQRAMQFGVLGSKPWNGQGIKFICPSPGYDRHFRICETFGIEMIAVPMTDNGIDMDLVEELVSKDDKIKGIWCVPKYSNPDGITYSDETVKRLAKMKTAASDFRIFWDQAYFVHALSGDDDKLLNILDLCNEAGNPNRVYIFASTSKITFASGGVAFFASSENNIAEAVKRMGAQTINPNKMSQWMHYEFFKTAEGVLEHMKKHAAILKPKFDAFLTIFKNAFQTDSDVVRWTRPKGGYFISVYVLEGCAVKVIDLCKECGLSLTPAGATYPMGIDDSDSNIRIAPSCCSLEEISISAEILVCCIRIAVLEKLMED